MGYSEHMKRKIIASVLAVAALFPAIAQTTEVPEQPATSYEYEPIRKGDQLIAISLGIGIPLFNLGPDGIETKTNIFTGGLGTIGFSQFINTRIALGGEITFAFNSTLGENLYFYIPMMFTASWETVFDRIRVPVSLGAGFAFQTYNSVTYFGPVVRPRIGAYYQYNPEWSFGVGAEWNAIFQWYEQRENNRTGNIMNVTAGMRYHF
ncbi:MAG: hypothetical protein BWY39_00336 [Spirochaetes bacterium ADurb.Bin269]|nr:MAG: hypothetical protein BWY39_00336 [Spirochaetes bacterium ADurb.Bin269]